MAWVESHQSLGRHPKTRKMARILGIDTVTAIGHLHLLWWWALDYADDGDLDGFEAADIATGAEWAGDPKAFVQALKDCGTGGGKGFLTESNRIHDWHDYAGKLVERRKANRDRMRDSRSKNSNELQTVRDTSETRDQRVSSHRTQPTNPTNQTNHTNQGDAPKPAPAGSSRAPSGKPTREQLDAMKDALAAAIGYRPANGNKAAWGPFQSAAASLIAEGAKPEDVPRVAKAYRREWPDVELTAPALAKHWARFSRRKTPERSPRGTDPRTEADLLLQEAWRKAREREDLDDAKREEISRDLVAALNHESNPVGAVKEVRERHAL